MSDHRSYFSRNNTIVFNSEVNTGRNPVTELFFGSNFPAIGTKSFSRFIFDLDLEPLQQKITEGYLNLSCNTNITHAVVVVVGIQIVLDAITVCITFSGSSQSFPVI